MLHSTASSTLVVVIGSQRGGEQVWQSMITHLIQPLRADLGVLASFDQSHELLLQHAQHIWRVGEYRDWGVLITELVGAGWQANVTLTDNLWGGVHVAEKQNGKVVLKELAGSGAILLALRLLVLRFLDNLHGHSYTQVVLTRADLYHVCAHPLVIARDDEVITPEGEGDLKNCVTACGYSDRHSVFSFSSRRRVLGALEWLVNGSPGISESSPFIQKKEPWWPPRFVYDNLEKVLAAYAHTVGMQVREVKRTMFVAVNISRSDKARWGPGGPHAKRLKPAPLAGNVTLWCKYEREYEYVAQTCRLRATHCAEPDDNWAWVSKDSSTGMWIVKKGMGVDFQKVVATVQGSFESAVWARYEYLAKLGELSSVDEVIQCNCTRLLNSSSSFRVRFEKNPSYGAWKSRDRKFSWSISMISSANRSGVLIGSVPTLTPSRRIS